MIKTLFYKLIGIVHITSRKCVNFMLKHSPLPQKYLLQRAEDYISLAEIPEKDKVIIPAGPSIEGEFPALHSVSKSSLPATGGDISRYFVTLANTVLFTSNSLLIYQKCQNENYLIKDLSCYTDCTFSDHDYYYFSRGKIYYWISKYPGCIAVINTPYAYRNYFHFLVDTMSRLAAIQLSGIKVDWYYLSAEKEYEKECIEIFGLDKNKVISPKLYGALTAKELLVPSLPYKYAKGTIESVDLPRNLDHTHWKYIKDKILDKSPQLEEDYTKIYLSRANAPQRKVSNEKELSDFLLKKYGIKTIYPEDFSVAAQAAIFNKADVIVSAHGAGLTNLIFASENATVIEIFPENYKPQHYRMMCEKLSLRYFFTCVTATDGQTDFEIPLEAAEEIINYALA